MSRRMAEKKILRKDLLKKTKKNIDITLVYAKPKLVIPILFSEAFHQDHWKKKARKNFTKLFAK